MVVVRASSYDRAVLFTFCFVDDVMLAHDDQTGDANRAYAESDWRGAAPGGEVCSDVYDCVS